MDREQSLKNSLVKRYCQIEKRFPQSKQSREFYLHFLSIMVTEKVKNITTNADYVQSKEMSDVRDRFRLNFNEEFTDSKDFQKYFYNKFLEDIKNYRKNTTGSPYSKKQQYTVDTR